MEKNTIPAVAEQKEKAPIVEPKKGVQVEQKEKAQIEQDVKRGFFETDGIRLPKGKNHSELKEEISKYSPKQLCDLKDGKVVVSVPGFRATMARIIQVKRNDSVYYNCELPINNRLYITLSSKVFGKSEFDDIILANDQLSYNHAINNVPVRIRFGYGKSTNKNASTPEFRCLDIIFPGLDKVIRHFFSNGDVNRINVLSRKSEEQCKKQGIDPWNPNHKLYLVSEEQIDISDMGEGSENFYPTDINLE